MDEQKIIATNLAKNYVIKESALFGRKKKIVSAVKDITLEIPKGQIIGVLGINGAGKDKLFLSNDLYFYGSETGELSVVQ